MTNREKFKEVFGFTPRADADCVAPKSVCDSRSYCIGLSFSEDNCPFLRWWDKEYRECFQLKEEFE